MASHLLASMRELVIFMYRIFQLETESIVGLVVEFHLAKVGARVRFPDDAIFFPFSSFLHFSSLLLPFLSPEGIPVLQSFQIPHSLLLHHLLRTPSTNLLITFIHPHPNATDCFLTPTVHLFAAS